MARTKHPDIKRYISMYFTQLKNVKVQVRGDDLLSLGYPSGPQYKEIFDAILERKLAGELPTKAEEIAFVLSRFPNPGRS